MMSHARFKRELVGLAALVAPLPLPFNGVLGWPLMLLYLAAVAGFLRRNRRQPTRWLPAWAMNVLAVAYLPFFYLDLTVLSAGRIVEPVVHLLLFAVLLKLLALERERDKWQTLAGVFFLFLAAMATSVHPSVVIYLVAFLGLLLLLLTRFAFLHVLAGFGHGEAAPALLPLGRFLTLVTLGIVLVATPLFVVLPRVRTPYIVGRGGGSGSLIESSGFSDEVTLDSIGLYRDNPEVVMRLRYERALPPGHPFRFKTGSHDLYRDGVWRRPPREGEPLHRRPRERAFFLSEERPVSWVSIWLRPFLSPRLPLPVEAVRIDAPVGILMQTPRGTVSLLAPPEGGAFQYRVGMAAAPVSSARPPTSEPGEPALDLSGVTPAIAGLAARVAGSGTPRERAEALERHFLQEYEYTLDFVGRGSRDPLGDFLFRFQAGHCEYFASAMVLMLRSQGIPARLATGFLGAEYNPLEGYYIVRQLNAHAWAEAYLPGEGWQIFEPTPPAGRPTGRRSWMPGFMSQAWDYLMFRWDRYVVTYGFYDQARILFQVWSAWRSFWDSLGAGEEAEPTAASAAEAAPAAEAAAEPVSSRHRVARALTALFALLAGVVTWVLWRRRAAGFSAAVAYQRLRRRLGRRGLPVGDAVAPLALRRAAGRRFPGVAAPTAHVIDLYLRESFGGRALAEGERQALRRALTEAEEGLRRAS